MPRSLVKGPYIPNSLRRVLAKAEASGSRTPIKTWARAAVIMPSMVGYNFHVYNGKKFIPISITEDMIGQKLGEFSPTRIPCKHTSNKKERK